MRCINPADPPEGGFEAQPEGEIFPGGGEPAPADVPEWKKQLFAEYDKHFHRLLYETTRDIETSKAWKDLVWAEALGKDILALDPRIEAIQRKREGVDADESGWIASNHAETIEIAIRVLLAEYLRDRPRIKEAFKSEIPGHYVTDPAQKRLGLHQFLTTAQAMLQADFVEAVEDAAFKAGKSKKPKGYGVDPMRDPWWRWRERQERGKNPRASYHDDRTNRDVYTSIPSPSHLRGLRDSQQILIEPWTDKLPLTPIVADEMYVRDVARKPNGADRRCRNPWFVGYSHDNIKEVFWSKKKPTKASHGHRYGFLDGPYRTQREAEAQTLGGELEGGGFYQVIGKRAKPRHFHSFRGDTDFWPGHYEFGFEFPPPGGRPQERGLNPREMNPKDKAFALKHNIPASTWNDPKFQRELRSYIERHGTYPRSVYRVPVPDGFPKYMSAWGKSPNVLYDAPQHSNKGKRIHHFGEDKGKGKKPWLVSSQERGPRFLAYVGGEFEADGEWIRY